MGRLSIAVEDGAIIGAKIGAALIVIIICLSWWMGDYWTIRQQAQHGEQVYRAMVEQQQRQQAQTPQQKVP